MYQSARIQNPVSLHLINSYACLTGQSSPSCPRYPLLSTAVGHPSAAQPFNILFLRHLHFSIVFFFCLWTHTDNSHYVHIFMSRYAMLMDIVAAFSEPDISSSPAPADSGIREASPSLLPLSSASQPPPLQRRSDEREHSTPLSAPRPAPHATALPPSTSPTPVQPPPEWKLLDVQVC
jgi:hypothetical protein